MTKTYLLTGATGFVGHHVFQRLCDQGARIRLVVRTGKAMDLAKLPNVESIVQTDDLFAESQRWWEQACEGIDTIIHIAWYVEPGKYLTAPANLDCLAGTLVMAKAAAVAGVRRFVGIGTCFEYDLSKGALSTDTPLRPQMPYGAAKAASFLALNACLPALSVEFSWCRIFFLYGEGEDSRRLVSHIRERLSKGQVAELTAGEQQRDYLDVKDAAQMIVDVVNSDVTGPVNICSGFAPTVRELAEKIADEYGRRDLLKFGARAPNQVDPPCILGIKSDANLK